MDFHNFYFVHFFKMSLPEKHFVMFLQSHVAAVVLNTKDSNPLTPNIKEQIPLSFCHTFRIKYCVCGV